MKLRWMPVFAAAFAVSAIMNAEAKVELAPVFSDNAVLQRDVEVPVWGFADPGEKVTVKFAGQAKTAVAGKDGKWSVKLSPLAASKENRTLEASGPENSVSANNILVGEVWLASGQSNMEQPLWGGNPNFRHRNANGTGKEVADSANMPLLRFTRVPYQWGPLPSDRENIYWYQAVPGGELENTSGTAFFFARELQKALDIPVGILIGHWGGTRIEPWTPPEGFDSVPELADIARNVNAKLPGTKEYKEVGAKVAADYAAWLETYKNAIANGGQPPLPPEFPAEQRPYDNNQQPTVLYNKMLYGYVPYAFRGAIWYQGESNMGEGMLYKHKMRALLNGWKKVFNNPKMKLYFVELAPFAYWGDPAMLPELKEAQQAFAAEEKDAGIVVISDAVHDVNDIHPADKEIVGKRLAYLALNRDYGRTDIKADSPKLKGYQVKDGKFVLDFDFVKKWKAPDGEIPYFEIAGMDGAFYPGKVKIDGKRLIVGSDKVSEPKALRYMWHPTDEGKLANEAGLVLGAFRIKYEPDFAQLLEYYKARGKLVYEYDLKSGSGFGDNSRVNYIADNSADAKNFSRVIYLAELENNAGEKQFVCVSMDPFTSDARQIGVPVKSSGASFQTKVSNMSVLTNVPGVRTGMFGEGNIEFWPNNYGTRNAADIPGADNNTYDFGDEKGEPEIGYGSMQIHNFGARQTVFAYNKFSAGADADVGIGNQPGGNPDWTFSGSMKNYKTAKLYIFVQ